MHWDSLQVAVLETFPKVATCDRSKLERQHKITLQVSTGVRMTKCYEPHLICYFVAPDLRIVLLAGPCTVTYASTASRSSGFYVIRSGEQQSTGRFLSKYRSFVAAVRGNEYLPSQPPVIYCFPVSTSPYANWTKIRRISQVVNCIACFIHFLNLVKRDYICQLPLVVGACCTRRLCGWRAKVIGLISLLTAVKSIPHCVRFFGKRTNCELHE